ncbi:MAG: 3-methyl-2-oxobutanoate hydroxymethyltransferase [Treponema sp.]|nr:3-methyl-2-oxobutanoate hydroxymethyltransferase [Treponema sp.]
MTTLDFLKAKQENRKISMITCYDATFAKLIDETDIDCILIGDSCSMVMHGETTTIPAKMEWMVEHTRSVRNGTSKYIVADMPFLSTRKGIPFATECAGQLLVAGANCVKIEGVFGQEDVLHHLVMSGIPVMAHLGLTPQFFQAFGGHKMQGKTEAAAEKIIEEAKKAEELGCFCVLLECIPASLAEKISKAVNVPVIGIGAGVNVDGQVLVLQDMLGMSGFKPRFVRQYLNGAELIKGALNQYAQDVHDASFPGPEEIK